MKLQFVISFVVAMLVIYGCFFLVGLVLWNRKK